MMNGESRLAPAKINLALHVTGRRDDGYHLVDTLAVFADRGDRIGVAPAQDDRFTVLGPYGPDIPRDESNLVLKARNALRAHANNAAAPVSIALEKNLPAASGIGGGSSDAAATLKGLNAHWGLGLDGAGLSRIGLALGADLPMCLHAGPLIARGIGEAVTPLAPFPALHLVLVNPGVTVSTRDVFSRLREFGGALPDLPFERDVCSIAGWLARTRNDLEKPALECAPEITRAMSALHGEKAAFARMSGSGATCFGLFEDRSRADVAAAAIKAQYPGWFVEAVTTRETRSEALG